MPKRQFTEEHKRKMRENHADFRKEKHPRWKGEFEVFCEWCGKSKKVSSYLLKTCKMFFCNSKCHGKWKSKYVIGKNASNFKDGRKSEIGNCILCNKEIELYYNKTGVCNRCIVEATRKKMSKNHTDISGRKNPMFGKIRPKIFNQFKSGYYKNIWFRSNWELLFAQFLNLSGHKWQYEPKTFDLGDTTYTPDFYIPEWNLYVEIKGYFSNEAKKKFNLFKKLYSKIKIQLLMKIELQKLGILM